MSEANANFLTQKMDEYFEIRDEIEKLEDKVSKLKEGRDTIKESIIEHMEEHDLQQVKDGKGRMVYLKEPAVRASFVVENKEAAIEVLKKDWNMAEFFQEMIPPSTLSRIIKERMVSGEEVPDTLFKVYIEKQLGTRK